MCNRHTTAARLIVGAKRQDHITPILRSLHWLPVTFRVQFKVLLLTFKALNGKAPHYLEELLPIYRPGRQLRSSADLLQLKTPRSYSIYGDRAYSIAAPACETSCL